MVKYWQKMYDAAQNTLPEVFTDGSCKNNGKPDARGGIGVYWGPNDARNVSEALVGIQSSDRAKIRAAIRAIEQAREQQFKQMTIRTDSHFLFDSVIEHMGTWLQNGWKTESGEPVENRADFEDFIAAMEGIRVRVGHVPAFTRDANIKAADRLAREGIKKHSSV